MSIEAYIYKLPMVRTLIRFSKRFRPPGFEGISLYEATRFFIQQLQKGSVGQRKTRVAQQRA